MFIDSKLFIYRAISPLHCGAAEGSGGIDLPVARERTTGHPIIPASSLKGVWRDCCKSFWPEKEEVKIAFGSDPEAGDANKKRFYAGCLGFTDAQILFLPVRASSGTFAMITCPLQVRRYIELRCLSGLADRKDGGMEIYGPAENTFSPLSKKHPFSRNGALIFLEDEELEISTVATVTSDKWIASLPSGSDIPERLRKRTALVSDEVFKWFCRNGLEVVAHNILKEGKQSDNLWYEEVVPYDSIFFSLVLTSPPHQSGEERTNDNGKYLKKLANTIVPFFQVGGHETTGRGLMEVTLLKNKKKTLEMGSKEEEADDK
jgi:CRISPR-associated protein Cmr4